MAGAREVLVKTLGQRGAPAQPGVDRGEPAARGQAHRRPLGYVYVPDTGSRRPGRAGAASAGRSSTKAGLIIDERFNSGGQIPDRFIELLNRPLRNYWAVRDGKDWQSPPVTHFGPKAMLINGWSGSGGDCFPFYFRQAGLGPLIGMRTWGGLIGITGAPPLVDGGSVTVPTFGDLQHQRASGSSKATAWTRTSRWWTTRRRWRTAATRSSSGRSRRSRGSSRSIRRSYLTGRRTRTVPGVNGGAGGAVAPPAFLHPCAADGGAQSWRGARHVSFDVGRDRARCL